MTQSNEQNNHINAQYIKDLWIVLNGLLLAGVGIIIFALLVEFGRFGYVYIFVGGGILILLILAAHWYLLREYVYVKDWIIITAGVWIATILMLSVIFTDVPDIFPDVFQVPSGIGACFVFCPCSMAVGPTLVVIGAIILKQVR